MSARAWLGLVLALSACKSERTPRDRADKIVEEMGRFADRMCACRDRACADQVQAAMSAWSEQLAATYRSSELPEPDEATKKRLTDAATKYAECHHRHVGEPASTDAAVAPAEAGPTPHAPPEVGRPAHADRLVRSALDWATRKHPRHAIDEIRLAYVDAAGILDETYGHVSLRFGRARPPDDDPKRRTGLPVPAPDNEPRECARVTWSRKRGWDPSTGPCREVAAAAPRCTVSQIWQRAIERGAPEDAVAILVRRVPDVQPPEWHFTIQDGPRNVNIGHRPPA